MSESADTAELHENLYREGIERFNRGEYFEAHEVWEDLWHDCEAADRRFFQALIQAAVAAFHWGRGNGTGAARLYRSGRKYMEPYRPAYRGLAVDAFWDAMAAHLAGALGEGGTNASPPVITRESARQP